MVFANKVSLSRVLSIPFFVASLFYYTQERIYLKWIVVFIFCFAMFTDMIDGLIARIRRQKTALGKVLDPLADKLFLFNAFLWIYHLRDTLPLHYKLPLSVVIIVISRDLIILLGFLIFLFLKIEIDINPNFWGKLTTFFQMATILSLLLDLFIVPYIWSLACFFTVISGVLYIRKGILALNVLDIKANNLSNK